MSQMLKTISLRFKKKIYLFQLQKLYQTVAWDYWYEHETRYMLWWTCFQLMIGKHYHSTLLENGILVFDMSRVTWIITSNTDRFEFNTPLEMLCYCVFIRQRIIGAKNWIKKWILGIAYLCQWNPVKWGSNWQTRIT